ncbi:alpha/beta fold hydrolase [Nonomuraea bangladeshensis]
MSPHDVTVTGDHPPVPVRVYPATEGRGGPGLVWMHGGAFIGGSLDMPESDAVCRALAANGITCVSVGYRLAPGFGDRRAQRAPDAVRFPLPLDDCERAWAWARHHLDGLGVDPRRLHVGGASAGGALAASLALRLHDNCAPPPAGVVLAYPLLHAALPPLGPELRRSLRGLRRLGAFSPTAVSWMARNYVGRANLDRLPEAFPGGRDLTGFPPAMIVNSERDSLRASGEAFAGELLAHGRPVEVTTEPGTSHGHLNRPRRPPFGRTISTFSTWLSR